MGKGTQQTTSSSSTSPTPQAAALYNSILGQIQNVASTPYQSYTGELVSPVNAQQTAGINNINANAGYANPYIQQATGLATNAANPLTASQIQNYMSPYTQSVVDATQAQFNKQNAVQQAQLTGNNISQGALGGNRVGIGQASLASQQATAQAPVIAGLYNQGYGQAVQTAQQQYQANPLAAASSIANFGIGGQNAALQGANAQIGAGTLQQQTGQAQDTAAYNQFLQQQAYPFQTAQWLASLGTGVGSQLGSTSTGQTTAPAPSPWSQIAGLGIAGAGLFLKDGGAVHRDGGGGISGTPYGDVHGYVPTVQSPVARALAAAGFPSSPSQNQSNPATSDLTKQAMSFAKSWQDAAPAYGGDNPLIGSIMGEYGGSSSNPLPGLTAADYGEGFAKGGPVHGYADGGDPVSDEDRAAGLDLLRQGMSSPVVSDQDRATGLAMLKAGMQPMASPAQDSVNPDHPLQGSDPEATQAWRGANPLPSPNAPVVARDDDDALPSRPQYAPSAPLQRPTVQPFNLNSQTAGFGQPAPTEQPSPDAGGLLHLSPNVKQALLTAGLAMLASRSPNLGNAIGEGGLAGLSAYGSAQAADLKAAQDKIKQQQDAQKIQMEAERLHQEAQRAADDFALRASGQAETSKHNRFLENQESYSPVGAVDVNGVNHPLVMEKSTGKVIDAVTGKKPEDSAKMAVKGAPVAASMDDQTAEFLADRVMAGDTRALVGLGRGAQGAENLAKINSIVARKAAAGTPISDAARSILGNAAQQAGYVAAERTQAQIMAKLSVYGRTAYNAMDLAERMSDDVPRSQFVPINKAINAWKTNTGDPKIVALGQAIETLTNEYARAIGGGHGTVSDKEHARERLSAAQTPEQLRAVIGTMRQEILLSEHAMPAARQQIRDIYNPSSKGEVTTIEGPKAAPGTPTFTPPSGAVPRTDKNGKTWWFDPNTKQLVPGQT